MRKPETITHERSLEDIVANINNDDGAPQIRTALYAYGSTNNAIMKSFCNGCKHWEYIQACENNGHGFHFCNLFDKYELKWRKLWCNGKLKEE